MKEKIFKKRHKLSLKDMTDRGSIWIFEMRLIERLRMAFPDKKARSEYIDETIAALQNEGLIE